MTFFLPAWMRTLLASAATLVLLIGGGASGHTCCHGTLYGWHRTFHHQNPLDMPLDAYFIPRARGRCNSSAKPHGAACWPGGIESVGMERLGQIPNDLELDARQPVRQPGL